MALARRHWRVLLPIALLMSLWAALPAVDRVTALAFALHSHEFAFDAGKTLESNLAASPPTYCLVYELLGRDMADARQWRPGRVGGDDGAAAAVFGFVRFGVTSNVSSTELRNALVLSVHSPGTTQPGQANLDEVQAHKSYSPRDVAERVAAAEAKKQRLLVRQRTTKSDLAVGRGVSGLRGLTPPRGAQPSRRRLAEGTGAAEEEDADTFDVEAAKSLSFTLRPQRAQGGNEEAGGIVEGSYAVCFSLDRTATPAGRLGRPTALVERVEIEILESFSFSSISRTIGERKRSARQLGTESGTAGRVLSRLGRRTTQGAEETYLAAMRRIHGKDVAGKSLAEILAAQHAQVDDDVMELLRMQALSGDGHGVTAPGPLGSSNAYRPDELRRRNHDLLDTIHTVFTIIDATEDILRRSERMQATAESTFTRIWVACVFVLAAITVSAWGTFTYTRHIVVKKKLL